MKAANREIFIADARLAIVPAVEGKPVTLEGYALVWNVLSSDRGGYKVRLRPGSARFTSEVHALWNHEYRDILAVNSNGTLRYFEDDIGIRVEIEPNLKTTVGADAVAYVDRKDVRGMSFGIADEPVFEETIVDGQKVRDYVSYLVDEFTITGIPAFVQTTIGIKSDPNANPPLVGYSRRTSDALTLQKFKFDSLRLPAAEPRCRTA